MNKLLRKFDWLGFITRELPIVALVTWWLIEKIREGVIGGPVVLSISLFAILTGLNYWRARVS